MSSFWNFVFGAILVLIWIISGGYVTQANVYLTSYKNEDSNFHNAYWYTFWAAFITWTLIGIFIILIILSVIGVIALFGTGVGEVGAAAEEGAVAGEGLETAAVGGKKRKSAVSKGISWLTIGFLVFALILIIITGVLAALAASNMVKSSNYSSSNSKLKTAYIDCIIAASLCLGAAGILIIGIIVYIVIGEENKKKAEAQKELVAKERALNQQTKNQQTPHRVYPQSSSMS